jgi:hypothetical protein
MLVLAAVVGVAILVKRLGQPVGMAALASEDGGALADKLLNTITYQTAVSWSWSGTLDFLAEQFGPSHLFWLTVATVVSTVIGLLIRLMSRWRIGAPAKRPLNASSTLFLWLIFGLIILEMVTLLDPSRQNPRYIVMFLPLFYLIAAKAILDFTFRISPTLVALAWLIVFTFLSLPDLRIALVTPEPAYETAFKFVRENWQPGDALLTMNTPAAELYRTPINGFTVQVEADQFLLNKETAPVDRWVGSPWVGTAADFNAALNAYERAWLVIDSIRLPVYFRGDWQAVINSQMEQVWSQDNALIYRTRLDRIPLPSQPDMLIEATLGDSLELTGFTLQIPESQPVTIKPNSAHFNLSPPISQLRLTLFWRPLYRPTADYTTFVHLRNQEGATVAQYDGLPLNGTYPTSRWQSGETVIDPLTLPLPADLPPGHYTLWTGMYQLETLERLPVANDVSGENAILLGEINYQ